MESIKFAYKSPDGTGACKSAEDREKEISAFLDTIKWIHPGHFISRRGDPESIEAVVVLRHPLPAILRNRLSSWLQKKLPKLFGGSLCSLDSKFRWSAYRVRAKRELTYYYAVDDARALKSRGYDIQVTRLESVRLHLHRLEIPSPSSVVRLVSEPFEQFLPKQSYVVRASFNPLFNH